MKSVPDLNLNLGPTRSKRVLGPADADRDSWHDCLIWVPESEQVG